MEPHNPRRRHAIIPDGQLRPGDDLTHIRWAAAALVEYLPDVIVVIGDWGDFPSLSTHDQPGTKEAEGRRVKQDIDIFNEGFELLTEPIRREQKRRQRRHLLRWNPDCHFLFGNHEDRITRAVYNHPKWDGFLTLDALLTPGFQRHPYLSIVEIDGIKYSHFFPNPFSGRPIGGTIINRLGHIGSSFVQGHQQGFQYASKQYPDHIKHGLVCGRFYQRLESYRPQDVQMSEWNGIVVLNRVHKGDFDLMPLRMDYLREKYSGAKRI